MVGVKFRREIVFETQEEMNEYLERFKPMKLFTCNDHNGHWPVPTASVIIAKSKDEAKEMLIKELKDRGISDNQFTLTEINPNKKQVIVLSDGEY